MNLGRNFLVRKSPVQTPPPLVPLLHLCDSLVHVPVSPYSPDPLPARADASRFTNRDTATHSHARTFLPYERCIHPRSSSLFCFGRGANEAFKQVINGVQKVAKFKETAENTVRPFLPSRGSNPCSTAVRHAPGSLVAVVGLHMAQSFIGLAWHQATWNTNPFVGKHQTVQDLADLYLQHPTRLPFVNNL